MILRPNIRRWWPAACLALIWGCEDSALDKRVLFSNDVGRPARVDLRVEPPEPLLPVRLPLVPPLLREPEVPTELRPPRLELELDMAFPPEFPSSAASSASSDSSQSSKSSPSPSSLPERLTASDAPAESLRLLSSILMTAINNAIQTKRKTANSTAKTRVEFTRFSSLPDDGVGPST